MKRINQHTLMRLRWLWIVGAWLVMVTGIFAQTTTLAPSHRVTIRLGERPWKYIKNTDPAGAQLPGFDDSKWLSVGLPYSANQTDTYLNEKSGGGEGELDGNVNWYRLHFTLDPKYAKSRVIVEFEGVHTGAQVYINGQFIPGNSALNPQATHVVGFVGFAVDLASAGNLKFDGSDNVLAVKAAKNDSFFENPGFSQAFRFGQHDAGIFRPVNMYIVDPVHIPQNDYAGLGQWGTYVATTAASEESATVRVQTNILNQGSTEELVTLTTQIVDESGKLVAEQQDTRTIAPNPVGAFQPELFDQTFNIDHPNLWWPNASKFRKRDHSYMYKVFHTVSVDGAVVDSVASPLGIRTITWNKDLPIINGQPHHLYGASGRYGYPGLGTSMPEEQQWRDLKLLAEAGGNLYRPGHSSQGPRFLDAADAYGIFVLQPSGDGENGFHAHCDNEPCNMQTLKAELHRDMIVRDRNHPSVLSWEANNGQMDTTFAQRLKAISNQWDYLAPRAQADRTPLPENGDLLSCSRQGCEWQVKQTYPDKPAYGAEYWGNGIARYKYDWEIAFAASYVNDWRHGLVGNTFGIAHWYLADEPGEINTQEDGTDPETMRANAASMMDANRFPRLLYYIYQAAWTPFEVKPVVALAHHWNRSGNVRVNAFSNCPSVRLLINGVQQGQDQIPNPATSDASSDLTQNTTLLPFQTHWDVQWQSGTLTAQCLDTFGNVLATDQKVTAGAPAAIKLEVVPDIVKPTTGEAFAVTANGSDAAFVVAKVVDSNGNLVPTASNNITFAVNGPATYMGGTDAVVYAGQGLNYHAPGDPELAAEGGLTKIALRSQFTPGVVTVTATSPGLQGASTTLTIHQIVNASTPATAPSILVHPSSTSVTKGQAASFLVTATGADPLQFQWFRNGSPIAGATAAQYVTDATTMNDNGAVFSVIVTNNLGSATSNNATLTVVEPAAPQITLQPQSQTVAHGQIATFTVAATGSPTLKLQWYRNGTAISGATGNSYTTKTLDLSNNNEIYTVTVTNPVNTITSVPAVLTVTEAIAPFITTQPQAIVAVRGTSATFTVVAGGSAPMSYQWYRNGSRVGTDSPSFTIDSVGPTDEADYSVTVTNIIGSATSATAHLKLAPPGFNLALGKTATSSEDENGGVGPNNAIDGDGTTRWSSAFKNDEWITIDLGAVMTFNRIILKWENAYGKSYLIQVPDGAGGWKNVYTQDSSGGGTEDFLFPTQHSQFVRLQGVTRSSDYGYSLFEFEVYNSPVSGDAKERYTVLSTSAVQDNLSKLVWMRADYGYDTGTGAQFTLSKADAYCQANGMRLPTKDEAVAISGNNTISSAFPQSWTTWVSDIDPSDNNYGYQVLSSGIVNRVVAENNPGRVLCTQGTKQAVPVITQQPQAQTSEVGTRAHFTVTATGSQPMTYQWKKNNATVSVTGVPYYDTPVLALTDSGAVYSVSITGGNGLSIDGGSAALTVTPATGNNGGGNNGGGNNGGGNTGGGTPPTTGCSTVTAPGTNLALGKLAVSTSDEGVAFVAPNAVDGDLNSRWSSKFSNPQSIQVDLGSVQTISQVILRWEAAYGTKYSIDVSVDGKNWSTVYPQNNGKGCVESITFTPVAAQFVRMYGTERSGQYGFSLWEFEVYGAGTPVITTQPVGQTVTVGNTAQFKVAASGNGSLAYQWFKNGNAVSGATNATYTTAPLALTDDASNYYVKVSNAQGSVVSNQAVVKVNAAQVTTKNLALGAIATSSGDESVAFPAKDAIDGNVNSRWSSKFEDPQWLQIDLGASQPVGEVVLHWENAHGVEYQIQTSNDAANWVTVYTQTAGQGGVEDLTFPQVTARYVRMFGTKRNTQYGYSLFEFEVYAGTGSQTPTQPTTPLTISAQPVAASALAGTTAQYTVAATGSGTLTYQWRKNETPINGATSATYYTPVLQATDTGASYSVIVTDANGSVTSNAATLTVTTAPNYAVYNGLLGVTLNNNTRGKWANNQVYITVLGIAPGGKTFSWSKPDGTLQEIKVADNDATGHLSKNGNNYANYSFTLADAKELKIPPMGSGRIFVSYGEPMYIRILNDANGNPGYAGPDPNNPTDANLNVYFDWYEFTYGGNDIFINTTQVDQFGMPLLLEAWTNNGTAHQQAGILETRADLINEYKAELPQAFQGNSISEYRIQAPSKKPFADANPGYYDSYINDTWTYYASHPFSYPLLGYGTVTGQVVNNQFVFHYTQNGTDQTLTIDKPTTTQVLECSGPLTGTQPQAHLCAAFNRHVTLNTATWLTESAFYTSAPANYYSAFWHRHSIGGLAYGFAYDDVGDHSSTVHVQAPEHLALGLGW